MDPTTIHRIEEQKQESSIPVRSIRLTQPYTSWDKNKMSNNWTDRCLAVNIMYKLSSKYLSALSNDAS